MRRVLCCVDDSEQARAVARYASELAEALGHELVLFHVTTPTHAPGLGPARVGRRRLEEVELLGAERLLARVAEESSLDSEVRRRSELGPVADRILEACDDEDAALVVLGSRGRGGLTAALLGSVSTQVAARAPCPCVIVSGSAAARLGLEHEAAPER